MCLYLQVDFSLKSIDYLFEGGKLAKMGVSDTHDGYAGRYRGRKFHPGKISRGTLRFPYM